MKISENALYVTGKQLQKPFYLGESLEEAKITMSSDSEALDYGELYAKQYGYGILSNKQIGSTTPVYAHEEFEEVPTDEDALDYAKIYNSRTNTSRYTQDNNAERANIKSRSNTRSLITNEKHTEASLGQRQKNAIDNYYKNHKLPNGVDFVDLEKLSYNNEFRDNPWIAQDIADLINHVNTGSKYGVMFTEDNEVAIHNISKKELETISNLENYEFDPTYKTVAKDLAKVAPEAPDFSIDLGDPMFFDFNVIENDYYNPNVTDEKKVEQARVAEDQLNRVYAKKFLKENHFSTNKNNIAKMVRNIETDREEAESNHKDTSAKAAYEKETKSLSNKSVKTKYQKDFGKKKDDEQKRETRKSSSQQLLQNTELDL